MKNDSGKLIVVILWSKDVQTPALSPSVPTVGSVAEHDMKGKRNVQNDKFKDFPAPPPRYPLRVHDNSMVGIVYNDLLERVNMKLEIVKEVIVISSDNDDLSTNEQITLIGDVSFSTIDDDSDDDDTDDESYEEHHVNKQQSGSILRGNITCDKAFKVSIFLVNYI
ncbi:hypothetical protein Tco_0431656 [Tanacetum coccineum]